MQTEYNKASEEVLYINTVFNLLQSEIKFQSSLKQGKFGRNTRKNPKIVLFVCDPWEIKEKKQVTHIYSALDCKAGRGN